MYQLDVGAVIKALLAHSTYLKELGVVDEGQLGGSKRGSGGGCCARWRATYGNAGKGFSNELQADSDKSWCFFIRRVVLLWLMVVVTSEI